MHDAKGRPLTVGDRVFIPATVKSLDGSGSDYCNVTCSSALGRRPDNSKETIGGINTGVLVRANENDVNSYDEMFGNYGKPGIPSEVHSTTGADDAD